MASIVFGATLLFICSVTAIRLTTVRVEQGNIQGIKLRTIWNKKYIAFKGIRYAKPPIGELRFRAPQPPDPWKGIYNASTDGSWCPQINSTSGKFTGNEDCLFLNVYTHKLSNIKLDLRPVLVWIHGGAFKEGNGGSTTYGPDYFLEENIVLVSIQYRLGLLGYLCLQDAGVPGNNGQKDQVMALRWVQKNIAKFGGDPKKVIIFGQSAGGASVHLNFLSPITRGLFHGAIAQSGSALDPWGYSEPELLRNVAFQYGNRLGCNTTDAMQLRRCLLRQPEESLVSGPNTKIEFTPTRETLSNNGEERFLTEQPSKIISAGRFSHVPFITGSVTYEAGLLKYSNPSIYINKDPGYQMTILSESIPNIPDPAKVEKFAPEVWEVYYPNNVTSDAGTTNLVTDVGFLYGINQTVDGQVATSASPLYYYYFTYYGQLAGSRKYSIPIDEGPVHADELGYLFYSESTPKLDIRSEDVKMVRKMVKMWTNFAKTGNPTSEMNSLVNVKWDHVTKTNNVYLKIDKNLQTLHNLHIRRMELWEKIMASTN